VWENWGRRSGIAILKPGCTLEPPGHHFKYTGARLENQNRCPCEHSLKFLVPREEIIAHSYSHILCPSLSLTRTHACTCTKPALPHRKLRGARLDLATPPSSSCIWAGAHRRRGTRQEQREALLASTPRLIPTQFRYQGETRTRSF